MKHPWTRSKHGVGVRVAASRVRLSGSSWTVLCCGLLLLNARAQETEVVLPQGRIVGIQIYPDEAPGSVEIFLGIPFATAPVGRLRFYAPGRHRGWNRTLFAHKPAPRCAQTPPPAGPGSAPAAAHATPHSEDCLYLNVWTPQRASRVRRLPVVVFLHSASWSGDGSVEFPGQDIAAEGVVLVQPAFRLNVFGFFTVGSAAGRGNLGLLDQYMALLWVKENIIHFGGDPGAITLMGHSAGAMSVLYHIVSPRTEGLFQRAVVMSPTDLWRALDERNDAEDAAESVRFSGGVAALLGCGAGPDDAVVHCLQSKSTQEILAAYQTLKSTGNWSSTSMRPVCDVYLAEHARYVPRALSRALSRPLPAAAAVPVLFGTTDLEAIDGNDEFWSELRSQRGSAVLHYATHTAIPELLRLHQLDRPDTKYLLTEAVRWEYFGSPGDWSEDAWAATERLARAESAARWGAGAALVVARLARLTAPSPLYAYRYTQQGGVDLRGVDLNYTGAAHGTELVPVFGVAMLHQLARRRATPHEEALIRRMRFITNFVKLGSPVSSRVREAWPPYRAGSAHIHRLQLDATAGSGGGGGGGGDAHSVDRDSAFWLQYLPRLANLTAPPLDPAEYIQQLRSSGEHDGRMRGAVYGLASACALLVAVLCAGAVLLWRAARARSRAEAA